MFRDTTHRPGALQRALLVGLGAALTAGAVAVFPSTVSAFKPYTHYPTAEKAYDDVVDDGEVTIDGKAYTVRPEIVTALVNQPAAYNAGVIGPDGFPDLAFGQSQIHPEETGEWLQHIFTAAWDAQDDPNRSVAEKQQILAFAYGFMTHAAGDMWAHTLINKIADGVFPGVGEILNPDDLSAAEIALRHVIAEGYVGDATPGFDGNPERSIVPGEYDESDVVDFSDDATPRFTYDPPTAWIYETLVDPNNPLPIGTCGDGINDDADDDNVADDGCPGGPYTVGEPEANRGPLIDFFLDMQARLEIEKAKFEADAAYPDCWVTIDEDCYEGTQPITVQTVRGTINTTIPIQWCDFPNATTGICVRNPVDIVDDAIVNDIGSAYLGAWIDDIEVGLQHWPELGQQLSDALFDAGTYRDAQNFWCRNHTKSEDGLITYTDRVSCEDSVGLPIVLLYTLGGLDGQDGTGFIPTYLLSMLGAPDFVGDAIDLGEDVFLWLQDVLSFILPDIDILDEPIKKAKDLLMELVSKAVGFDVEEYFTFIKSPTHWMNTSSVTIDLPFADAVTVDLFQPGDREYLDDVMGLVDPTEPEQIEMPDHTFVESSRLKDNAEWTLEDFEVAHNAVTMSKLLLLDADQLNQVVADHSESMLLPGVSTALYTDPAGRPANVMIDGLDSKPWLRSIDSDHSWRQDRLPAFFTPGFGHHGSGEGQYAGTGQFPMWESCIARPAFRDLFHDWENGDWQVAGNNFPDLGDTPTAPADIAGSLTAEFTVTGHSAVVNGTTWVAGDHGFVVTAADTAFQAAAATTRFRTYTSGSQPGAWTEVAGQSASFALPSSAYENVKWIVEWEVTNGCETVTGTRAFYLDKTAPTVVVAQPSAAMYDTDDMSSIVYTATDGGSGVQTQGVTFDGLTAASGQVLDMYTLQTGTHTVAAATTDFVGNTATVTKSFTLLATTQSLRNNLDRAVAEGKITDAKVVKGLKDKLDAALKSHASGKHPTEKLQLVALVEQLMAQRGKGIDATVANRMIGWANDLIAAH